ncbi:MAG: discoidin domain-containing protein, partial [Phycisphaerae bacterium]|nr:discoidin domain-containing protein [Phycisphaerae bacterium]
KDDAELANAFMKACSMLADEPDVKILLYQKAAVYGAKDPVGHASALRGVEMLMKTVPDRKAEWEELLLNIRKAQYAKARGTNRPQAGKAYIDQLVVSARAHTAAGNTTKASSQYRLALMLARAYDRDRAAAITAELRVTAARVTMLKRRLTLLKKFEADPSDQETRLQLVMMELLEFDNPAASQKLLNQDMDDYLRTYIPLAAQPIEKTADTACMDLGKWYEKLLDESKTIAGRTTAIKRATAYYKQFMLVHEKKDMNTLRAGLAIKRLNAQAAKLGITTSGVPSRARWADVLKLIDPAKHTIDRKWTIRKDGLACYRTSRQLISIPQTAMGGYDMHMTFTIEDDTEAAVLLPVGSGYTSLVIGGWNGRYSGLCDIDGKNIASPNPTTVTTDYRNPPVKEGEKAAVNISVRLTNENAKITATLNGKPFVTWSGKQSSLSLYSRWSMSSRNFALAAYSSQVVWHSVRLKLIDPIDLNTKLVSRDATYKISSTYSSYPPLPSLLTGEGKYHGYRGYHAFCTDREPKPNVTIDLKKSEVIRRIIIENRRDSYNRYMVQLDVEVSSTGKTWRKIWQSEASKPTWTVDLKTPARARFMRITLAGTGSYKSSRGMSLALRGVKIYADR